VIAVCDQLTAAGVTLVVAAKPPMVDRHGQLVEPVVAADRDGGAAELRGWR